MSIANPRDSQSLLWMLALMGKELKMFVPEEFHEKNKAVRKMLKDDVSGIIDTLTDFMIESALVDFKIESDNKELQNILNDWLKNINIKYNGKVPKGINALAEEYYKERWKSSSFPILKILEKDKFENIILPSKLLFIDGGSVYVDKEDAKTKKIDYKYYLGKDNKEELRDNCIITKPYGRWFDLYPDVFLVKRGIYRNYLLMKELKTKQGKLLEQMIPYILEILKGESDVARQKGKVYKDSELRQVLDDIKDLIEKSSSTDKKETPARVAQDELIKHLIPEIEKMFNTEISASIERNILAGFGFTDIAEAIVSRKEIQLNPKAFISEIRKGVKDFKSILELIIYRMVEENEDSHRKYMNTKIIVTHSPIKPFMTDRFLAEIRLAWKNGILSNRTYNELLGFNQNTEVMRREQEARDGTEFIQYPHITINDEEKMSTEEIKRQEKLYNEEIEQEVDENGNPISEDKINDKEKFESKKSFNCECIKCGAKVTSESHCKNLTCLKCGGQMRRVDRPGTGNPKQSQNLETAPYNNINDLPTKIKNNMSPSLQRTFLSVFNNAYKQYNGDETRAFRVAWSVIKKISKRDKNGKWIRKTEKSKSGKQTKVKATKELIDASYKEVERESEAQQRKSQIDDLIKIRQLELIDAQLKYYKGQEKLQDKFLKKDK